MTTIQEFTILCPDHARCCGLEICPSFSLWSKGTRKTAGFWVGEKDEGQWPRSDYGNKVCLT